jgi:superfamily I DNA/RNA helicase
MGFASFQEDICDRYFESGPFFESWTAHLGPKPVRRATDDHPGSGPFDRPRRIIRDFWRYYHQEERHTQPPAGFWERHHQHVDALYAILNGVAELPADAAAAWSLLSGVEERLRHFFRDNPVYGPLSPAVLDRVVATAREIRSRCLAVERELEQFQAHARTLPPDHGDEELRNAVTRLRDMRTDLEADLDIRKRYFDRAEQVRRWGTAFLEHFARLAVQAQYRPALQGLHRLRLNDQQERFVALDHGGAFRIQGASGSGKTVILIHRALRLALEHPTATVRVFTINRSLAELLTDSIAAVHGTVPPNLTVSAFYDLLVGALNVVGSPDEHRLVDDRSGERIAASWRDFYHHRGRTSDRNVFADPAVRELIGSLEDRVDRRVDACRYLRDETVYVESAYRAVDRERYLTEPRTGRGVHLRENHRRACLRVLAAWDDWLRTGRLCDVDGLSRRAADWFEDGTVLARLRAAFPTDHVLLDEVQDFSTLELQILRRLVPDPDGPNRFFLVGDLNQKAFAKQHASTRAGFDLTGRSRTLARNYRNTRQILAAAYRLPERYPAQADEPTELAPPELSQFEGGRPVVIACSEADHASRVLDLVRQRSGQKVAVVSENEGLLAAVRTGAEREKLPCHELFRVEDLDLWRRQNSGFGAGLVLSRLEAVKGFEFDTVVVCDLSDGVVPRPGTPASEFWREAAVTYAALTRARDELVLTYVNKPSAFLEAMADDVEWHDGTVGEQLARVLDGGG